MASPGQNTRALLEAEIARVQTAVDEYKAQDPPAPGGTMLLDEILRHATKALDSGDPIAMYNALQELGECR